MRGIRWFEFLVVVIISVCVVPISGESSSGSSASTSDFSIENVPYSLEYPSDPVISHNPDVGSSNYNKIDPLTWGKAGCKVHGVKVAVNSENLYLEVKLHPQDSFGNYKYVITISEIPTTRMYKQLKIELTPRSQYAHVIGSSVSTAEFGPTERKQKVLFETTLSRCVQTLDQRTLQAMIPLNLLNAFVSNSELLNWKTGFDVIYSLRAEQDMYYLTGDSVGLIWTHRNQEDFSTWNSSRTESTYPSIMSKDATVVTYNTLFAGAPVNMRATSSSSWDWFDIGYRIPKFEEVLRHVGANIIGFQECVGWQPGGMFEYVPAELSRRLKMNYVVGDAFNGWSVALFTRFKILDRQVYTGNALFRNAALRAELEITPGIVVNVIIAHVDYRTVNSSMVRFTHIIEPYISGYSIVMGDLNQHYALSLREIVIIGKESEGLSLMHQQGWIREASVTSSEGSLMGRDHVFFSPSLALYAIPTTELNNAAHPLGFNPGFLAKISDHLPVIAKFSFQD